MDGFEFLEECRRRPEWQAIPVVVVTARDPSLEEKRRLEGSVVRILQKGSCEQQRLLEEIKAQVELQLRPPPRTPQTNR
jgi:CheY-like chemotaxis protein